MISFFRPHLLILLTLIPGLSLTHLMARETSETASPRASLITVEGTVDGFRRIHLRNGANGSTPHQLLQIRFTDGETRTVALGPDKRSLSQLGLQHGDAVRVRGEQREIADRPVLFAREISVRESTRNRQQQDLPDFGQRLGGLRGEVKGFQEVELWAAGGESAQHLLVRIQMPNEQITVMGLGKVSALRDLDIQRGDHILAKGFLTSLDDIEVFIATQVKVLDRSGS